MANIMEAKIKKWGNSLGIILSKELVNQEHLKENQTVGFLLVKPTPLKGLFGIAKGKIKKSAQQIKDELRRELYE